MQAPELQKYCSSSLWEWKIRFKILNQLCVLVNGGKTVELQILEWGGCFIKRSVALEEMVIQSTDAE